MTSVGRARLCGLAFGLALLLPLGSALAQGEAPPLPQRTAAPQSVEVAVPSPLSPVVGRDLTLRLSMELWRPTWSSHPLYAPSYRIPRLVHRRELLSVGGLSLTSEYEYAESTLEPSACFVPPCQPMEYMRTTLALDYRIASLRIPGLREVWELGLGAEVGARTTDLGLEYTSFIGPRIRTKRDSGVPRESAPPQPAVLARVPGARPVVRPLFGLGVGF